jgi:ribosomal-protein-alanine N-acetyltransferase
VSLLIRRGEAGDLPEIAAIQSACPTAAAWRVEDYLIYDLRVAVSGGRIAGFLASRSVAADESEILNIAVAPPNRRRGVAKALIREFLNGFKGDVFLELRASNSSAFALYKSLGFQVLSIRPDYYGSPPEPGIVMKLHSC